MRNPMKSSRPPIVAAVALGIFVMTLSAPIFAGTEPLVVKNVSVSGATVQVTVKNVSLAPASSTVAVEAVVNGTSSWSFVPVMVLPGQSAAVSAGFTGAVSSVRSVGFSVNLQEDTNPI